MTRTFWTTACVLAASAMSLSACATPNYPIRAGEAAAPTRPQYPTTAQAAPSSDQVPAAAPPLQAPTPAPAVESRPLPPASGGGTAPPSSGQSAPSQSAPSQSAPSQSAPSQSVPSQSAPSQGAAPEAEPPQNGLPPGYTPPSAAPAPSEPPPSSYAAPPRYTPPAVSYRPAPPRYIAGGKVVEARGMFRDYEVRKGDHVDAIARDLQTTRKVLLEANHLEPPYALQPGQHLKVPVAKAYEVQSGDTMAAVAKRFGVTAAELADLNDLSVRGRLKAGDKLALPDHIDDRGPTRLPATMVARSTPYRAEPAPSYRAAAAPPSYPAPNYSTPSSSTPSYSAPSEGGAYVPSPAALAAAQRLAAAKAYAAREAATPTPPRARSYTPPRATYSPPGSAPGPTPAAVIQAGQGRFLWPVRGEILSGFGGAGPGRRNDGVDIKAPQGTVVRAAAAGNVVYAGDQVPGFGNLVLIKHVDGWVTAYAHLDSITVQMRQSVVQGQAIGEVGQSGGVAGPQLHFEVRYAATPADKAKPVDPILVLPR